MSTIDIRYNKHNEIVKYKFFAQLTHSGVKTRGTQKQFYSTLMQSMSTKLQQTSRILRNLLKN